MPYGSYGAWIEDASGNLIRPHTKKQLREAVQLDPDTVSITSESIHGSGIRADQIKPGEFYGGICGPDPALKRSWYATVRRDPITHKLEVI